MDESIKAAANATEEIARTAGKAIDAGHATGSFIAQVIKEPLMELAASVTDSIKYKRIENALDMQKRLDQKILSSGMRYTARKIQIGISLPLIEAVSMEESAQIRELWANLAFNFSNAQSETAPQKSFITVLKEMSELDALIFSTVYSAPEADTHCILTEKLPSLTEFFTKEKEQEQALKPTIEPSKEVKLALTNLFRLQCLQTAKYMGGPDVYSRIYTTPFGRALFEACTSSS